LQKSILILINASRIEFLRESVTRKLHIPLKQLFQVHENCKDDFFQEKILIPIFRELAPEANLNDLLQMRSYTALKLDQNIEGNIKNRIKDASLRDLILVVCKHQDEQVIEWIEANLKTKIYDQNIQDSSFEELLELQQYFDKIPVQIIEPILRDNSLKIIKRFANSQDYYKSRDNTRLLIMIVEYLTETQWEEIFEAFFKNDQICDSRVCNQEFETLFQKSLEITVSVPSYWISFGEKLPEYKGRNGNKLKQLIESHLF
jgi:hypothetical protein